MKFRKAVIIHVLVVMALIALAINGSCEEMTRGFVMKVDKHRIVLAVPNSGERTFDVTGNTFVVWRKRAIPISELRRHTLVQLTSKNSDALQILVVEVPK